MWISRICTGLNIYKISDCRPLNTPKKDSEKRNNPDTPPSLRKKRTVNYKESEDEEEDEDDDSEEVDCGPTEEEIKEAFSKSKIVEK